MGALASTQAVVQITNATAKAVTINAATPSGNLTISNLFVSSPAGTVNTLQLTKAPASTLQISSGLTISNGFVRVTNSTVQVGVANSAKPSAR